MRFYNYLNELTLRGELSFGFELEAIFNQKMSYRDMRQYIFDKLWGSKDYGIEADVSIGGYDGDIETSFEFQSPPMQFTPQNIKKSIDFLTKLFSSGDFRTNQSCGFHVHFGMPELDIYDRAWVLVNIALDPAFKKDIFRFKDIMFLDNRFANGRLLTSIKIAADKGGWDRVKEYITADKYQLFRLHPQGTLEWRGPRNFLNKGAQDIPDFFKLLYRVISQFVKYRDSNEIPGYIKRKDFIELYKDSKEFKASMERKKKHQIRKDFRFSEEQDLSLIDKIFEVAPWLNNAMFKDANIKLSADNKSIFWKNGIWLNGVWESGNWWKGEWRNGTWKYGIWNHGTWKKGIWESGAWFSGTWENGTWKKGVWIDGKWLNGEWYDGSWKGGDWLGGKWFGGKWLSKEDPPKIATK